MSTKSMNTKSMNTKSMSSKSMSRKSLSWTFARWPLLIGIIAAGIAFSGTSASALRPTCPEISTLLWATVGMLIATTTIHTSVTILQAELVHIGRISDWCSKSSERRFLLVITGVLMMAANLILDILLWAWTYRHVGAIKSLKESIYFSGITFTTVGYGDITLTDCWKLLSVGQSVNGVLMAGWSTAQLIFLVQRMMTINLHNEGANVNRF